MTALVSPRPIGTERSLHSDVEQSNALLGRRLAERFEVRRLLGFGGSSLIFEGWHLVLRHPVAVKVLRADYASDPELVNHFAQEAMVTAQMRSPHVVRVFDTGLIDEAVPYTVLELLRGRTLNELRRDGRTFTPEEAIDLVLQACRALDESHGFGIVHRDIKPDNLFLAELPDGSTVLKVIDFGVAKQSAAHTFLTEAWVGTPGYMAPEQITTPGDVDARADIWALGVVLFELLTGRSPFRGTNAEEILASTLNDEPLPLAVAHQGLPLEVYSAVECCLAKDPNQRFRNIQELAGALVRARAKFAQGADVTTGIVRLPDNWDMRLTPAHGWTLQGATIALEPPKKSGAVLRRRLSLGAGVVAGALFGVALANYPLQVFGGEQRTEALTAQNVPLPDFKFATDGSIAADEQVSRREVGEVGKDAAAMAASMATAHTEPEQETAASGVAPAQPKSSVVGLLPLSPRGASSAEPTMDSSVNELPHGSRHIANTTSAPGLATPARTTPTATVAPLTKPPAGTASVAANHERADEGLNELLTPWTKTRK